MTPALANVSATARRKIARRLLPFLCLLYILAQIDRVNVGFAGLDMTQALHFSNEAFGFGAGIFFFGYCLLQIPGAMAAQSWSSRKWIAAVMIGWGMLASLTGVIQNSTQFSVIRFLLGLAEGGFFPAVVVYLTHWFRQEDRGKAVAMFMAAIPASGMIGGPVAGRLLSLNWLGISGWRWLFMLEGIPVFVRDLASRHSACIRAPGRSMPTCPPFSFSPCIGNRSHPQPRFMLILYWRILPSRAGFQTPSPCTNIVKQGRVR